MNSAGCIDSNEFTSWALPMDVLDWLNRFIKKQGIRSVIEAGSGLSTIWLASLMQDGILERSLSLEHDPSWYNYTRLKLKEKGLLQHADVQLCPLKQQTVTGQLTKWYDIIAIAPFPTDLILVDGPPGTSWILPRHPAPHLLKDWTKPGTWIVLDDYGRDPERETVRLWLDEFPALELVADVGIGKGLAVLRFRQA